MTARILAAAALLAALQPGPALAGKPASVASAGDLKAGQGAVRLSVQAQTQQWGTLHVFFLREGGDPANKGDMVKFSRSVGVPLAGVNQIDPQAKVYALPAGRYQLLGFSVKCDALPPEGTSNCSVSEHFSRYETPARRYAAPAPEFEVVAGRLTDAGEYIVEAPLTAPIAEGDALKWTQHNAPMFEMRVRQSALAVPSGFANLPPGPAATIPDGYKSNIRCPARPKGAMMYLPFTC